MKPRRAERDLHCGTVPVYVLGAPFTFRTFHNRDTDRQRVLSLLRDEPMQRRIDTEITVTLAAVPGLRHHEPVSTWIELR